MVSCLCPCVDQFHLRVEVALFLDFSFDWLLCGVDDVIQQPLLQ